MMISPGTTIGGRYRVEERVSVDANADTWRAVDETSGRTVAIRVYVPGYAEGSGDVERFREQAEILLNLDHPGIAHVYDYGVDPDGSAYLVMEYVIGEPLSAVLKREGPLSPDRTMALIAQAAAALQTAHDVGMVHRDVSPGNLLVRPDGIVVLIDFAIDIPVNPATLTAAGSVLGTAAYLSPEQAMGERATARSDIYALGVVAYQCLTGRPPFAGSNPLETAMRQVRDAPPPLPAEIPAAISEIVERALAKDPDARWPSAEAFAAVARDAEHEPADPVAAVPSPAGAPGPGSTDRRLAFTSAHPQSVGVDSWHDLLVVVHDAARSGEVEDLIDRRRTDNVGPTSVSRASATRPVSRGTVLTVVPKAGPGMEFNPERMDIAWHEDVHELSFRMRCVRAPDDSIVSGHIDVLVGPLLVALMPIALTVDRSREAPVTAASVAAAPTATSSAQIFDSVFASYSRRDTTVVDACARLYTALGVRVLTDRSDLRTGEDWRAGLEQLINSADIFQLFWSSASSASPEVANEWRLALALSASGQRGRFIRPVFWETPMPAAPESLSHLHFSHMDLDEVHSLIDSGVNPAVGPMSTVDGT